jgi:peptide/nickel transport system substrate-binding protein
MKAHDWRALLLALALVATGCRGSNPFTIGRNDINPTPRGSVSGGGTLHWPIVALPFNFNFNSVEGNQIDEDTVINAIMPSTFTFDSSGQPVLNRDFLTTATVTARQPQQVVTYEVNPKAVWSDGTPITAADFVAQWKALNGTNHAYSAALTQGYEQIAGVTQGRDAREAIVTFQNPYADWQGLFTPLYPASTNSNPDIFGKAWIGKVVASAGPFTYQGLDPMAKTLTLVRNDKWWGDPAKLESIVFHAVGNDPASALTAFTNGQVDFVAIPPDLSQLHKAEKVKATTVRRALGPDFRQLTMNGTSPTLQDVRVRKAVAAAIDRPRIAKELLSPLGAPAVALNNHIYMTNQRGYQNKAGDLTNPDPRNAATLLDQAGWKLSGTGRARNGQPMQIRLVIPDQAPAAAQEAGLIKGMLSAVGVTLTVQTVAAGTFFNTYVGRGDFDLALFSWQGTVFPISAAVTIYQSPTQAGGQLIIRQNFARIGSDALDRLFIQALGETDPTRQIQLGNQIDSMIWGEVHSLTLYQRPNIVVQKSNLANFGAFGFATIRYQDIGFTKP